MINEDHRFAGMIQRMELGLDRTDRLSNEYFGCLCVVLANKGLRHSDYPMLVPCMTRTSVALHRSLTEQGRENKSN